LKLKHLVKTDFFFKNFEKFSEKIQKRKIFGVKMIFLNLN
jgi:hypothetical protein